MASTKIENPGECPVVLEKTQAQIRRSIENAEDLLARYTRREYEDLKASIAKKLMSETPANVLNEMSWSTFSLMRLAAAVDTVNRIFVEGEDYETCNPVVLGQRLIDVREELEHEVLSFARRSSVSSNIDRNMADVAQANAQGDVLEQLQNPYIVELVQNLLGYETAPQDGYEVRDRLSAEDQRRYDEWLEQKLAYQTQEAKAQAKREADKARREAAKAK